MFGEQDRTVVQWSVDVNDDNNDQGCGVATRIIKIKVKWTTLEEGSAELHIMQVAGILWSNSLNCCVGVYLRSIRHNVG